jgi:hypothetical protein
MKYKPPKTRASQQRKSLQKKVKNPAVQKVLAKNKLST